ncbi:MAG TPA: YbhB/YbcL family Raf kinase inhibitor-like protein [Bacteroidetes bacterium]|nr:YbhB/YbcL family Raf kinase inhibitor-like protein [Bacteroidota bacterium]
MNIISSAFQEGKTIPTKFAYHGVDGGKNISLPFSWSEIPPAVKSFAISIVDPHPVAKNWVHWFIINIPANVTTLVEGASQKFIPTGAKELLNTYGTLGYGGPEPPKGSGAHPYVATLYALNVDKIDLPEKTTLSEFNNALERKTITTAKVTGMYER